MPDSRILKLARLIVHYATAVQPGDVVLIRGLSPLAEPLIQALYQEALRAGAYPFPYMHVSMEDALAIDATDDLKLLSEPNPMLMQMYAQADVVIGIHAAENVRGLSGYTTENQSARALARSAPIKIQKARQADKSLRRCTTTFPTQAYAQAAGMSLLQYADVVFRACKVHLDDPVAAWVALREQQQRLVNFLVGKKHLHVVGENINLQMSIEGRIFINSAGTANLPDGEIFTGPVEDSVNGWVRFTYPAYYHDVEVQGIALTFEHGRVIEAIAAKNESFLHRMLDSDEHSRLLGEFAIATNTDIQQFTGDILLDEKMGGTIHLALGQGYLETGSLNQSQIHWDMICDMRGSSEIEVDGIVFYRDGLFLVD
jgi:aminopeptidase